MKKCISKNCTWIENLMSATTSASKLWCHLRNYFINFFGETERERKGCGMIQSHCAYLSFGVTARRATVLIFPSESQHCFRLYFARLHRRRERSKLLLWWPKIQNNNSNWRNKAEIQLLRWCNPNPCSDGDSSSYHTL